MVGLVGELVRNTCPKLIALLHIATSSTRLASVRQHVSVPRLTPDRKVAEARTTTPTAILLVKSTEGRSYNGRHSEPDRQAQQDLGLRQGVATNRDHAAAGAQELAAGVDQGQVAAQLGAQRDVGGQRPLPADA